MFSLVNVPIDAVPYVDECLKSKPLYKFRQELSQYITQKLCTYPVTCKSYGSTKSSSDIDVTIDGHILHIRQGLLAYVAINKFIKEVFEHDTIFHNEQGVFDVKKVYHFFDINFYLSNFGIKKSEELPDDLLSSYYLSKVYDRATSNEKNIKSQFYYSFIDILRKNKEINDTDIKEEEEDVYLNKVNKINILLSNSYDDADKIVENLSIVSTFEDECYHTQGAFFHVVLMKQRGIQFRDVSEHLDVYVNMMYASALENLSFAFTHFDVPSKRNKYLDRYNDAVIKIQEWVPEHQVKLKNIDKNRIRASGTLHTLIRKSIQSFV